jgi:WXG100 family type VII secretion target
VIQRHETKDRQGTNFSLTVFLILTAANGGAIRYRLFQNFKQLFVLQLNDASDYSAILGHVDGVYPSRFKGRGIFKSDCVYEFQITHVDRDADNLRGKLEEIQKQMDGLSNAWQSDAANTIRENFNRTVPRFEEFKKVVDSYVTFLNNTVTNYDNTESTNNSNASLFQ